MDQIDKAKLIMQDLASFGLLSYKTAEGGFDLQAACKDHVALKRRARKWIMELDPNWKPSPLREKENP